MLNVDISVAVATDNGLITPIVKNAAQMAVDDISANVRVCSVLYTIIKFTVECLKLTGFLYFFRCIFLSCEGLIKIHIYKIAKKT